MSRNWHAVILLAVLAALAMVLILYVTGPGMVLTGDSVRYIMGAENMVLGNGYSRLDGYGNPKPIVGFPPAFPASISLLMFLGIDKLVAPRILNTFFFCGNVFLVGWLIFRFSKKQLPAVLGAVAVLGFHRTVEFHSYALSEPGFIFLSLLSFVLLAEYQRNHTWGRLLLLGLVLGILPLFRYVSLAVLPVACLLILVFSNEEWKKRLVKVVVLGVEGILPTLLWFQRNARLEGTVTNRSLAYHPIPVEKLVNYRNEVVSWLIPQILQIEWRPRFSHLIIVLAVLTLGYAVFKYRQYKTQAFEPGHIWSYKLLPIFSLLFMYAYLATVFLSTSFLDASMSAYRRYLLPVYVYLVIFLLCMFVELISMAKPWRYAGIAGFVLWVFIFGFHLQFTCDSLEEIRDVSAYDSWAEGAVEAGEFLRDLDPSTVILTNEIDLVYLLGRNSFLIPIKQDNYTQEARDDFDHQLEAFHEKMENGAVLAIFDSFYRREFKYATFEELTEGLVLVHVSNTAEIFADPEVFPMEGIGEE
ncbi:MAG: phospholipid carrier-dependent glycosyltransferase [Anaerolineales bacterium]|nr:phospholipid carrier-dependent glycosyltransferase [Anaerolineales bacterium]